MQRGSIPIRAGAAQPCGDPLVGRAETCGVGPQTTLPGPLDSILHRARPCTRTTPEPMTRAETWPSDAKALCPDPVIVTLAALA